MAAEFDGAVEVEVVTLKERRGAERYRELRRLAGVHLPIPCVLLEAGLVSEGIPEQDALRAVVGAALGDRGETPSLGRTLRRRPAGDRRRCRNPTGGRGGRHVIYLEGFYGQTVEIPEDRLYDPDEELWVQQRDGVLRVGVSKVGVLLAGGVESVEFFVDPGDEIQRGAELAFFETFKTMRYVLMPVSGTVLAVNDAVVDDPELFDDDPYGEAWLIELVPAPGEDITAFLRSPRPYVEALEHSEHCAEGSEALREAKKGSPTCRALYGGLRGNEPGEGSLSWKDEEPDAPPADDDQAGPAHGDGG